MYFGAITKSDVLMSMLEDLADLFEQGAADGTPIRAIVGDDPVEFAEDFLRNYVEGQWINKERARLTRGHRPGGGRGGGMSAIRVRGLEKAYGELRVLHGVDLDVAAGTAFALLGANGA